MKAFKIKFEISSESEEKTSTDTFKIDQNIIDILDKRAKTPNHLCITEEESYRRLNEL